MPASACNTPITTNSTAPRSAPTTTTRCSFMPGLPCRRARPADGECPMRKLLSATAAALAGIMAGPVVAADMPLKAETPFAERFNWTSCYLGGHLGGGFARKDITDPVQLAQDSFLGAGSTTGITTVNPAPSGAVIGGQIGCDYQFASSWVVGVEGAVSGATLRHSTTVGLPLGPDTALV